MYSSVASSTVNAKIIDRILEVSQKKNKTRNITGLLVFRANRFVHLLEGPREFVESTLEEIKTDYRHSAVKVLTEFESESPIFPTWQMAYLQDEAQSMFLMGGLDQLLNQRLVMTDDIKNQVIALFRAVISTASPRSHPSGPGLSTTKL